MKRGQSLVVWAIAEGRGVAREVDEFLMGVLELITRVRPKGRIFIWRGASRAVGA